VTATPFDPPGSVVFTFRYYDPRAHKMLELAQTQDFTLTMKLNFG
jgi:hypothetical protein